MQLVGVNMYLVSNHPQHEGMTCALCNTLAVTTAQRGKGIGSELTKAAATLLLNTDTGEDGHPSL